MPKLISKNTRKSRLVEPYGKKLPNKNDELLNMLENDDTKIELIAASSLSGFIFKISNNMKSYIMKIVVLTDVEKNYILKCMQLVPTLSRKKRKKITEIKKDFVYESEIQNFINNESKRGGRTPICPEVTYTKIYDNRLSEHFLELLRNKITSNTNNNNNNNTELNSVIECLQYYFNGLIRNTQDQYNKTHYKLGIILMPEIKNSITLGKVADEYLRIADNHIYPQIIYLFLIIGIINFDMHEGNMLVSNINGIITTRLIDFGKVDNLNIIEDSSFLYANEKIYINEIREKLKNDLDDIIFRTNNYPNIQQTKHNFILKTMNIINILSWIINKRKHNYENLLEHQMDWFVPVTSIDQFMIINYNLFKQNTETINRENLDMIINYLLQYNYNFIEDNNYFEAFEILKNNYVTISTGKNTYRTMPVEELTLSDYEIAREPLEEMPSWIDNNVQPKKCDENDDNCNTMGGKKSTKKNVTRKSIRKSSKKSNKKAIRKTNSVLGP